MTADPRALIAEWRETMPSERIEHLGKVVSDIRAKAMERVWSSESHRKREIYLMASLPSTLDAMDELLVIAQRHATLLEGYASALDELADLRNRVADVQREAGMQALVIEQQDRDMEQLKKFEAAVAQGFLDLGAANQQINRLTCDLAAARDMNRHYEQERDAWPLAYKQRAAQTDTRIGELEGEVERIRAGMTELRAKLSAREDDDDIGYWRDDIDAILNGGVPCTTTK